MVQAVILEMTPELHVRSKDEEDFEVIKRFFPSLKGPVKRAAVKGTFRSELYPEGQSEGHLPTLIQVVTPVANSLLVKVDSWTFLQ